MSACCARVDLHSCNVEFSLTSIECLCQFRRGFLKTKAHCTLAEYRFGLVMLYVYRYWIIYLNVSNDSLQIFGTINLDSFELVWDSILWFSLGVIEVVDLQSASMFYIYLRKQKRQFLHTKF